MRSSNLEIEKMMLALGCGLRINHQLSPSDCDPEKQLLKSLKFYWENNSIFFLVYTSVFKRLHPYIHVDRLVKIASASMLSNDEMCLLAAICYNLSIKDQRFKVAHKKISRNLTKMEAPPKNETDKFLLKEWGVEESLKSYGVLARTFPLKQDGKLQPLKEIFKSNMWIKYRALFGSNTRADCAFVINTSNEVPSASEVARIIYSSRQAVSNYYSDLILTKGSLNLAG